MRHEVPGNEDRFSRQRLIPQWDQERLSAATAVVVGVGALGNEVAKNLALLGVGRLVLCDPDVVSLSNLSRSVLFDPGQIGVSKVEAAAEALRRLVPGLAIETRQADLVTGVGLGTLADADIVFGCLDSRRARLRLLARCALVEARLVDGGTHSWGGEVRIRLDHRQACHGCSYSEGQRAERDVPVGCDVDPFATPAPASILSTALVASWMTVAATRLLLGEKVPWRFLDIDGLTGKSEPLDVSRDPQCPHHEPLGEVSMSVVGPDGTVDELLGSLGSDAEPIAWALFSLPGICYHCNDGYDLGRSYRNGTAPCPHCGERVRVRFSQSLRVARGDFRLRELGVAPDEILAVRYAGGEYRWLRLK